MEKLKLILVDPQSSLCTAFQKYFNDLPNVEIVNGYFEQLPEFDCMVSAANSFGLMDGGIDLAIVRFFGDALRDKVQKYLAYKHFLNPPQRIDWQLANERQQWVHYGGDLGFSLPMDRFGNLELN